MKPDNVINIPVGPAGTWVHPPLMPLDLRDHAIENLDDYLTFIKRAQNTNREFDTVLLTPDQMDNLLAAAAPTIGLVAGPIKTLYGFKLITQEQD